MEPHRRRALPSHRLAQPHRDNILDKATVERLELGAGIVACRARLIELGLVERRPFFGEDPENR